MSGISSADLATLGLAGNPTLTLPVSVANNGTSTITNSPPASVSSFSSSGPVVLGHRSLKSNTISGATTLFYFTYTPSSAVTVSAPSTYSIAFTPTSSQSSTNYHAAFSNGSTWVADTTDIGSADPTTGIVTINGNISQGATLSPGTTYAVALYSIPLLNDQPSSAGGVLNTTGALNAGTSASSYNGTIFGALATLVLPAASSSATINYTLSQTLPTGVSAPSGTGVDTVWGAGTFTPTATVTYPSGSVFHASLTLPTASYSGTYSAAISQDGINWTLGIGTTTISGTAASFTYTTAAPFTLTAGTPYYVAIYN